MFAIAQIRALLGRLREADRKLLVFGASFHQYNLEPPLPEAAVRAWENRHGVELPAAYRAFLLEPGNGGAGPFYGVFPLGQCIAVAGYVVFDTFYESVAGTLRVPFAVTQCRR